MIPIDASKPEVKEIDGVKYSFLPIMGESELLYHNVISLIYPQDLKKAIAKAQEEIDTENKFLDALPDSALRAAAVKARALEISEKEDIGKSIYENPEACAALGELIDAVLIGWESQLPNIPAFPSDKHPSKCFKILDRVKLLNMISDSILIGETERKN